jgi:hypothetical protein
MAAAAARAPPAATAADMRTLDANRTDEDRRFLVGSTGDHAF